MIWCQSGKATPWSNGDQQPHRLGCNELQWKYHQLFSTKLRPFYDTEILQGTIFSLVL